IKFTDKGFVKLNCKIEKESFIKFLVTDTGIGIEKNKTDLLFGKFNQLHIDLEGKYGGTGLGLALSKKLVELMGGEIGFKTEFGKGSVFYFTIPLKVCDRQNEECMICSRKVKILFADDEIINQKYFQSLMESENIEIDFADDGIDAVEKYKTNIYDAVILDIHMPLLGGLAAAKAIRDFEKTINARTPIMILSGTFLDDGTNFCVEHNIDEYRSKPAKKDVVINFICKNLDKK
nr:ATP-binding protein [Spirochaetota bacterium]